MDWTALLPQANTQTPKTLADYWQPNQGETAMKIASFLDQRQAHGIQNKAAKLQYDISEENVNATKELSQITHPKPESSDDVWTSAGYANPQTWNSFTTRHPVKAGEERQAFTNMMLARSMKGMELQAGMGKAFVTAGEPEAGMNMFNSAMTGGGGMLGSIVPQQPVNTMAPGTSAQPTAAPAPVAGGQPIPQQVDAIRNRIAAGTNIGGGAQPPVAAPVPDTPVPPVSAQPAVAPGQPEFLFRTQKIRNDLNEILNNKKMPYEDKNAAIGGLISQAGTNTKLQAMLRNAQANVAAGKREELAGIPANVRAFEMVYKVDPKLRGTPQYIKAFGHYQTAGQEAYGAQRILAMLSTPMSVYNTNTGDFDLKSKEEIVKANEENKRKGFGSMYVGEGAAKFVKPRLAAFNEIQTSSKQVIDALNNLKGDFSQKQVAKFAQVLKVPDDGSTIKNFLATDIAKTLTPDEIEYVTAVKNLRESAFALRGISGMGQGSDMLRAAIADVVPGPRTPNKAYALSALNRFDTQVSVLKAGVPGLGAERKGEPTGPTKPYATYTLPNGEPGTIDTKEAHDEMKKNGILPKDTKIGGETGKPAPTTKGDKNQLSLGPKTPGQQLTNPSIAKQYLDRAKGDKEIARALASQDGWAF